MAPDGGDDVVGTVHEVIPREPQDGPAGPDEPVLAAAVGAALGDWLSYVVGRYFKRPMMRSKLYAQYRGTVDKALRFARRWGAMGVFIGRFSGPLRAFVPLAAGVIDVPVWQFRLANVTSALIWSAAVLSPGTLLGRWLH